jgi:hypothetical protein
LSTLGTWLLVSFNTLLFVTSVFIVEPYRRDKLVERVVAAIESEAKLKVIPPVSEHANDKGRTAVAHATNHDQDDKTPVTIPAASEVQQVLDPRATVVQVEATPQASPVDTECSATAEAETGANSSNVESTSRQTATTTTESWSPKVPRSLHAVMSTSRAACDDVYHKAVAVQGSTWAVVAVVGAAATALAVVFSR